MLNAPLQTSPQIRISIILTKLDGLVHVSVPVAEVGGLGVSEVNAETFGRAAYAERKVVSMCVSRVCCRWQNHMENRGRDQGVARAMRMRRR